MAEAAMRPTGADYLAGALCGLGAATIAAGWSVITRLAVTTGLDAWDIAALRFGVAGALLLPIVRCMRRHSSRPPRRCFIWDLHT